MKTYTVIANMAVELDPEKLPGFEMELLYKFIDLVESFGGSCGGGFQLIENKEEE